MLVKEAKDVKSANCFLLTMGFPKKVFLTFFPVLYVNALITWA